MALITTAGATNANSYISVADANSYFGDRLYTDKWDNASTPNKEKALKWATKLLDQHVAWFGYKPDDDQALRWPRSGIYDRDGYWIDDDIIPEPIQRATAELAFALLKEDRTQAPDTKGFDSIKVGPIALERIVEPYGRVRERGSGVVSLTRA